MLLVVLRVERWELVVVVVVVDMHEGISLIKRCRADSAVECILMIDYLLYCYLPLLPTYLLP